MDFGRIQEAQERRRQELRAAQRRSALLRELDLLAAERAATMRHGARANRPPRAARSLACWLRAHFARARAWRRA
ncbi:MAG TPA: hypothetical protein VKV26_02480 [Dehalococcoidia bacterium]|nr:hypothetical protein [Dehalococcoidia bacterium]